MGGVGWPLAAADLPVAIFLGFALILGWQGGDIVRVEGVPLLLSLSASVYGLVCGVFLDSPRRRRWDQRQRPRPGAAVPRISPTTQAFASRVPRSIPRRSTVPPPGFASLRPDQVGAAGAEGQPTATFDTDAALAALAAEGGLIAEEGGDTSADASAAGGGAPAAGPAPGTAPTAGPVPGVASAGGPTPTAGPVTAAEAARLSSSALGPSMPTARLDRAARSTVADDSEPVAEEPKGIELPTSLEPKAQRSPWAWAAPPEWTRDEDDEPPASRSAGPPAGRA